MSDIYGYLHAIGDKLFAELRPHAFERPKRRRDAAGRLVTDPFCARCGYHQDAAAGGIRVHPEG